jgi:hypothetical protein
MKKKQLVLAAIIFVCCFFLGSDESMSTSTSPVIKSKYPVVPFDSEKWELTGEYQTETYRGRKCLLMKKGARAVLKDTEFLNGVFEFDVAFPKMRGFPGVMWRLTDPGNYEEFYMRAHQSGNPDASQYTPVFNGVSGWQLYYAGAGFGAPLRYPIDEWMHVKIVVYGKNALIYFEDMEEPAISVELLHETKKGKLGFYVGYPSDQKFYARFANFSFSKNSMPIAIDPQNTQKTEKGTIMSWAISSLIEENRLAGKTFLTQKGKDNLTWSILDAENSGTVNISRLQVKDKKNNTVFAKVIINSEKNQIKKLAFGYSDRIYLFFNDLLFYSGNNTFRSRDYRYLGSVGYFDEVYLPLKAGKNELVMAVSETFGGWGFKAKFKNIDGITFDPSLLSQ